MDSRHPFVSMFYDQVPRSFVADALRTLFTSYEQGYHLCQDNMDSSEAADVRAQVRRAVLETNLRAVAGRYPTADIKVEKNSKRSSSFTSLSFGPISMTASKVRSPYGLPRQAKFRAAKIEVQSSLFQVHSVVLTHPRLYAILTHGSDTTVIRRIEDGEVNAGERFAQAQLLYPAFARLVFPTSERRYETFIDLFRDYPEVVAEFLPKVEDVEVTPVVPVRLRKPKKDDA